MVDEGFGTKIVSKGDIIVAPKITWHLIKCVGNTPVYDMLLPRQMLVTRMFTVTELFFDFSQKIFLLLEKASELVKNFVTNS